jgi:hypothetical protein
MRQQEFASRILVGAFNTNVQETWPLDDKKGETRIAQVVI